MCVQKLVTLSHVEMSKICAAIQHLDQRLLKHSH